jgi:hypothetical protein
MARRERRPVIEQVGRELCEGAGGLEQVEGHRIVELLQTTPLHTGEPDPDAAAEQVAAPARAPSQARLPEPLCSRMPAMPRPHEHVLMPCHIGMTK